MGGKAFHVAGWSVIGSDGVDDVCISVNPSLSKVLNCNATFSNWLPLVSSSVLYAKASMLLHVSFTLQLEFVFFLHCLNILVICFYMNSTTTS